MTNPRFNLALLLCPAARMDHGGIGATNAEATFNYGIVSPNTKTDLKLEQAIAGMKSRRRNEAAQQSGQSRLRCPFANHGISRTRRME
jgi:hypothetical protein